MAQKSYLHETVPLPTPLFLTVMKTGKTQLSSANAFYNVRSNPYQPINKLMWHLPFVYWTTKYAKLNVEHYGQRSVKSISTRPLQSEFGKT